jgi:4-hydroxythreonine-4-phosphate dehydrogenase
MMREAVELTGQQGVVVRTIEDPADAHFRRGHIDVLDLDNVDRHQLNYGLVSAMAGRAAYQYIEEAIELAMSRRLDATVTGPIHKEALNAAGYHYAGHTEIFQTLTNSESSFMMLACGSLRAVHVSTHVSLRQACDRVKQERVLATIKQADTTLRELGVAKPRIAVPGLNPHSGEGGLFGSEEIEEIIPAIEKACQMGIDATGPIPPDTVFSKARGGLYDVVIAMYHDQAHIPIKLIGFQMDEAGRDWQSVSGVNITLGLPIVRVSVDHGVAFDIAGQGRASIESLLDAIKMAARLARARLSGKSEALSQ